ncbi:hypothetical protein J4H86_25130 [Spiractinospora alimapuensis]|uniref:hypothetical protein n=1 Tax=Spiractinospora alimapuensis TaxID=2820884 RepID=UPI001F164D7E|nr:hypothetical protein [Spiractinospora alimapuensis]QVQ51982.1 hypothetical protein J4H86_25130 [Spiractinospora alimapuensis]
MIARRLLDSTPRRALLLAGGVVVLSAAGIGAGLLLSGPEPGTEPTDADAFAAPPACASVEEAEGAPIETHLSGGQLDTAESTPLHHGASQSCVWTSVDNPDTNAGALQVDFQVFYSTGDSSGADQAQQSGLDPGDQEAPDPLTVSTASGGGTSHAGFVRDNLVVRVAYTATDPDSGSALDADAATQVATEVANAIDAGL